MKRLTLICLMILCLLPFAFAEEDAFAPQGSYRVFCLDGRCGVQTLDGETVIPAQFDGILPIRGDLCVVQIRRDEGVCAGLWRLSTGEELLPCEYREITLTDTMVITSDIPDPEADGYYMSQLYDPDRRAFVITADADHDGIWAIADGQYFSLFTMTEQDITERLTAPDGTAILDMDLEGLSASPASHGIIAMNIRDDGESPEWKGPCRYYNTAAEAWLEGSWNFGYAFADGYAAVWAKDRKWYVIDETGSAVTPGYDWIANEDDAVPYGYGLFSVKQEDGWHIIRVSSGSEPADLSGPVSCVADPCHLGKGIYALPVPEGSLIFSGPDEHRLMLAGSSVRDPFLSQSAVIESSGKYGFLFDDLTVIEPVFDDCVNFLGDYGFVQIDGSWYAIGRDGHVDRDVSYPGVHIAEDESCYMAEYDPEHILCLDPSLQPITFLTGISRG